MIKSTICNGKQIIESIENESELSRENTVIGSQLFVESIENESELSRENTVIGNQLFVESNISNTEKQAVLILNGEVFSGNIIADYVVCADGGYEKYKKKVHIDCLVGDMDSTTVMPTDIEIIKYNPQKNHTDGELGLKHLVSKGYKHLKIYGLDGGRLDHILTNIALLDMARQADMQVKAVCNGYDIYLTDKNINIKTVINQTISVVPFSDELHISYTKGLYYGLKNKMMVKTTTLGISNIAVKSEIEIGIKSGVAIIFVIRHN